MVTANLPKALINEKMNEIKVSITKKGGWK
jgi:hypothetical protein